MSYGRGWSRAIRTQKDVVVKLDYDFTTGAPLGQAPAIPAKAECPFCHAVVEGLPMGGSNYWGVSDRKGCPHVRMLMSTGRIGEGAFLFEGYSGGA